MISHPDYKTVITQIYPKDDPWLSTDTVFAVKDDLVVDFKPYKGKNGEEAELHLDLVLAPKGEKVALISHPDYKTVITQIYPKDDPWLSTDTVFAVKDDLVVDFKPYKGKNGEEAELHLDLVLAPKGEKVA